ncbi:hypothetical protein VE03_10641, partial [Pseudogymnoascus sp. 23342-1-I1]
MRLLLQGGTGEFSFREFRDDEIPPPYAILSHTWDEGQEVTFKDLIDGTGKSKTGYNKIRFCGQQAKLDGLQHFWVDTCCIDKTKRAELQKAINSMFRWYRNATRCYVYLSDVSTTKRETRKRKRSDRADLPWKSWFTAQKASDPLAEYTWESAFRESRWFTRGWTLQELLAPASVEFFSYERERLGDKNSLEQEICEITGVPESVLQGASLSRFSDKERFSWIECRQTRVEEDKAYSLLGIFGVELPLRYGEGSASAFKRLEEEIDKLNKCLRELRSTDPCDDKKRIEDDKGGLLKECCRWIFVDFDYQQWRNDPKRQLLWVKGNPGKGKTMLLCGIIDELEKSISKTALLSYFFCQATDSRINNATAVLRGLIFTLIGQQPSLISHIREKYNRAGKSLFEDANTWVALVEIFTDIMQDQNVTSTYLVIDALDECVTDLPKLLNFIVQRSSISPQVKWIVSSRNWPDIEEQLENAGQNLSLELNAESVSAAVNFFIRYKVLQLAQQKKYDDKAQGAIIDYLSLNANDTFLWVALVCKELALISGWEAEKMLTAFPPGLDALYKRMLDQINPRTAKLCTNILATVSFVYRPITLDELASFVDMPLRSSSDYKVWEEIVGRCGSFLTLRDRTISFVHQSAKDFLLQDATNDIFPLKAEDVHCTMFSKSLQVMSKTLKRDIYSLNAAGISIDQVKQPDSDPLAAARYSCLYWVHHLIDCDIRGNTINDIKDGGSVYSFLRASYLYWLEALSLMKSLPDGIIMIMKLENWIQADESPGLHAFIHDARRFVVYNRSVIEQAPLQSYCSALIFAPEKSIIRETFDKCIPTWIDRKPRVQAYWGAALQTLEGHSGWVSSVAFSPDGKQVVSGSNDKT